MSVEKIPCGKLHEGGEKDGEWSWNIKAHFINLIKTNTRCNNKYNILLLFALNGLFLSLWTNNEALLWGSVPKCRISSALQAPFGIEQCFGVSAKNIGQRMTLLTVWYWMHMITNIQVYWEWDLKGKCPAFEFILFNWSSNAWSKVRSVMHYEKWYLSSSH